MRTRLELEQENAKIQDELAQIRAQLLQKETQLESKDSLIQSKDAFIDQLKEALILARNRQFAKASESLRALQNELFDEAEFEAIADKPIADDEDADTITVPAHQRQRSGRKKLPEDLPRIAVIHDLADDEKICSHGHALKPMGEKVSEQLDIIPMRIQVIRHIRKQYSCPCCDGVLKIAAKPKQPIEKSQASAGCTGQVQPDTFLREFSYLTGDKSPFAVCSLSVL